MCRVPRRPALQKIAQIAIAVIITVGLFAWWYWPRFAGTIGAERIETLREAPFLEPDPKLWDAFLQAVVQPDGMVDYIAAQQPEQRGLLARYLDQIARATPAQFSSDEARLAFYINAYNALTIDGVLHHWPLTSVRDVGIARQFFRERRYTIARVRTSLHGFESKVIRRYDARNHFALNCASYSCPALAPFAYRPAMLDAQLTLAAHQFINDARHNRYNPDTNTWRVSAIFEWYVVDFGGEDAVRLLLQDHGPGQIQADAVLIYEPYDWSLNSAKPIQD